jgi:hypothetical protein
MWRFAEKTYWTVACAFGLESIECLVLPQCLYLGPLLQNLSVCPK